MELESFDREYVFAMDPRGEGLLSFHPYTLVTAIAGYLYVVLHWGPRFMRDRKPYQLKWVTRFYNLFQIIASFSFSVKLFHLFYYQMNNSIVCAPPDHKTDPDSMEFFNLIVLYWWLRVVDFLDTVFFVLRKKQNQVTFLHVFHHVMVVGVSWISAYFGLLNLILLSICINSMVHAVMYSYYFLATLGPEVQKYLWWKKHLTKVQIVQFLVMVAHLSIPMFKKCGYPKSIIYAWQGTVGSILILFVNFYLQSYRQKKA